MNNISVTDPLGSIHMLLKKLIAENGLSEKLFIQRNNVVVKVGLKQKPLPPRKRGEDDE